jgi:hypothetical protein
MAGKQLSLSLLSLSWLKVSTENGIKERKNRKRGGMMMMMVAVVPLLLFCFQRDLILKKLSCAFCLSVIVNLNFSLFSVRWRLKSVERNSNFK